MALWGEKWTSFHLRLYTQLFITKRLLGSLKCYSWVSSFFRQVSLCSVVWLYPVLWMGIHRTHTHGSVWQLTVLIKDGTVKTASASLCAFSYASARAPSFHNCAHEWQIAGSKGVTQLQGLGKKLTSLWRL